MNDGQSSRRVFLKHSALGIGGVFLSGMLPDALFAAHREAHAAAAAGDKFTFLTAEEAADMKAFAAQVIPTDDTPGANEANVVYFVDNVLTNYEPENQKGFRESVAALNETTHAENPSVSRFSELKSDEQSQVMQAFEKEWNESGKRRRRTEAHNANPFEMLRAYTIMGFLSDPDLGGNKDMVGWQLIGYDGMSMHEPPFGYYDAELLKAPKEGGKQ